MSCHVTINLPLEISVPLGFDIRVSVHRYFDFLITTNKMQLFFIIYF